MRNTFATCINMRVGPNQFIYIHLFYLRNKINTGNECELSM